MSTEIRKRILLSNRVTEEDLIELYACQEGIDAVRSLLPATIAPENIEAARELGVDVSWLLERISCGEGYGSNVAAGLSCGEGYGGLVETIRGMHHQGYGYGYGPGGNGYGHGYGYGPGSGYGSGFDWGCIYGHGHSSGSGYGQSSGYCYGYGHSSGYGDGYGAGDESSG